MKHLGVISLMFIAFSLGMMVGQMSAEKRFRELSCYMDGSHLIFSADVSEDVVLEGITISRVENSEPGKDGDL